MNSGLIAASVMWALLCTVVRVLSAHGALGRVDPILPLALFVVSLVGLLASCYESFFTGSLRRSALLVCCLSLSWSMIVNFGWFYAIIVSA